MFWIHASRTRKFALARHAVRGAAKLWQPKKYPTANILHCSQTLFSLLNVPYSLCYFCPSQVCNVSVLIFQNGKQT